MVKKMKVKSEKNTSSFMSVIGVKNIFQNEKLNFVIGIILIILAFYFVLAFISYFSTGAADQSLIEDPREGEMMNEHHEFTNTCGSVGAYISWYFIKRCFGLPAFLIPLFIVLLGIHMVKAYRVNLLKWFMSLMILMIWASITFAKFLSPFFEDACFCPGGDHGLYVCLLIENLVGAPGLTAILAITAIVFLTYLSAETIIIIRKMLNPTKFIDKVKFKITNNDPDEKVDSYEEMMKADDENLVFDDPATQTVEFKDDGKAVIVDEVYHNSDKPKTKISKTKEPKTDEEMGMEIEVAKGDETADTEGVAPKIEDLEPYDPKRDLENYHYPTLDLLKKYDNDGKPYIDMTEQTANKNRIVEVLRTFGVEISSIKATVGPTVALILEISTPNVRSTSTIRFLLAVCSVISI